MSSSSEINDSHDRTAASLYVALAGEIRQIRTMIEEMAVMLAEDEHVALQHLERLQSFDLVAQLAEESAALLERIGGGVHLPEAVEGVRLERVQTRLRAALKAA